MVVTLRNERLVLRLYLERQKKPMKPDLDARRRQLDILAGTWDTHDYPDHGRWDARVIVGGHRHLWLEREWPVPRA